MSFTNILYSEMLKRNSQLTQKPLESLFTDAVRKQTRRRSPTSCFYLDCVFGQDLPAGDGGGGALPVLMQTQTLSQISIRIVACRLKASRDNLC
jgi:hypothetical protein